MLPLHTFSKSGKIAKYAVEATQVGRVILCEKGAAKNILSYLISYVIKVGKCAVKSGTGKRAVKQSGNEIVCTTRPSSTVEVYN